MRCSLYTSSPRTIVWPALLPPWKRTTTSAFSARRSVILPLPSSPHWAPTTTMEGISRSSLGGDFEVRGRAALVAPHEGDLDAHLGEARDGARADLCAQLFGVDQVGRHDHRALLLPALVDDRVELLEHPFGALLGAEVVDVQQVHAAEPLEELHVGALRGLLVGLLDVGQEARHRVDRDRMARAQ